MGVMLDQKIQNDLKWFKERDDCKLRGSPHSPYEEKTLEEEYQKSLAELQQRLDKVDAEEAARIYSDHNFGSPNTHRFSNEIKALISTGRIVLRMSRVDDLRDKNMLLRSCRDREESVYHQFGHILDAGVLLLQPAGPVPMLMDLEFLVRNPEQPLRSDLGFGINLMVETANAFHWKDHTINNTNCRIKALALARLVMDSVSDVCKLEEDEIMATAYPCSDLGPLSENLRDMLKTFD
jgi:hypothetical protein